MNPVRRVSSVIGVRPISAESLLVTFEDLGDAHFVVERHRRAPRPSELDDRPRRPGTLVVAPHLSASTRHGLEERGCSWVDGAHAALVAADGSWRRSHHPESSTQPVCHPRTPSGRTALGIVRRRLLTQEPWTQVALAASIGVSQPAVSQATRQLHDAEILAGGQLRDRDAALSWWLATYQLATALELHLYSLDTPWGTAQSVLDAAAGHWHLLSGEAGLDATRSWLPPAHATIYLPETPHLPEELVPIAAREEASVTIILTDDVELRWRPTAASRPDGRPVSVADPMQLLWDLARQSDVTGRLVDVRARLRASIVNTEVVA